MKNILNGIASLIFPPRCASCGDLLYYFSRESLCENCREKFDEKCEKFCKRCKNKVTNCTCIPENCRGIIEDVISVCEYTSAHSVCDNMVLYAKDNRDSTLFGFMADKMTESAYGRLPESENLTVTFVPRSLSRKRETGHDQSEILAKLVAQNFGVPMKSLFKKKGSVQQKKLGAGERLSNAEGSYILTENERDFIKDKTFLLCDDVVTTGASLSACASQLISAGAKRVYALTFAKSVRE